MSDTTTFKTMCPMNCHPTLCGMEVTVDAGGGVSITGDDTNPDSAGFLCMRGKAAHEIVGNPKRLMRPMIRAARGSEAWGDMTWDDALDRMAAKMREVGREAVGFWQGHGNMANDYAFGLKRAQMDRFANLYGCQSWNPAMICWGLGGFGLGLTGAIETSTKEDLGAHSNLVILWGANTVSQANTFRFVEQAKRRGARIVVIDVRRTEASALADELVLVRPGSDAALALAMMHVIVRDESWDVDFVAHHTQGFDALKAHVSEMTPAWGEAQTGIPADQITSLARAYATTAPAMIVTGGSSMHKGDNTWQAARAISCLPALTGNFGVPGGGLGPRHGGRSHGAGFNNFTAAERRKPGDYIPNQMEAIVEGLERGAVKVFVSIGSNVLSSFADTNRMRAALNKAEMVVAYDIFPNQMIREAADIVLPGTLWLEEIGAKSTNTHIYLTDRALPAPDGVRPAYDIYKGLADRLDVADVYPWPDQEAAMDAALDHPATGHATVQSLRAAGGHAALNVSHVAYPTRKFSTPSGKIEFYSERASDMGLSPLPEARHVGAEPEDLILTFGRTFAHFHAFYDHGRALPTLVAREEAPELWIAPKDAEKRGISDGDQIELSNEFGAFQAQAKVTPRATDGTVWIRDGWPGLNALTDGASVLPVSALEGFPFSVGQNRFGARVRLAAKTAENQT
jgi:anaerobic selenocysteine-containing dehydrogenase